MPFTIKRRFALFSLAFLFCAALSQANPFLEEEVKPSTQPVGSSFFRHLAFDLDVPLRKLIPFEKRGFGRSETITLVLLSKITDTPIKEYGKRRLKKDISLKKLTEEAGLNYVTLYKIARTIKKGIESKADQNLPPPLSEIELKKQNEEAAKEEKEKKKKKDKKRR